MDLIWLLKQLSTYIYSTNFHFIIDRNGNVIEHLFLMKKQKQKQWWGWAPHIGGLPGCPEVKT